MSGLFEKFKWVHELLNSDKFESTIVYLIRPTQCNDRAKINNSTDVFFIWVEWKSHVKYCYYQINLHCSMSVMDWLHKNLTNKFVASYRHEKHVGLFLKLFCKKIFWNTCHFSD